MPTIRFKYNKTEELKYIAHLDTLRVFTRAIRRANLPVSYSQGFNPHALIAFVMPLSLGFTSNCEFVDIGFEKTVPNLGVKLDEALPGGFDITEYYEAQDKPALITAAEYSVTFAELPNEDEIHGFFRQKELVVDKKSKRGIKQVDIMPMIFGYNYKDGVLTMHLAAGVEQTLNPELVLKQMNIPEDYQVCRENIYCGDRVFK